MRKRTIAVQDKSGNIDQTELIRYCRALQVQISEHVKIHWNVDATIVYYAPTATVPTNAESVTILNDIGTQKQFGFHTVVNGTPKAFVKYQPTMWQLVCSHETIETIIDPYIDRFVVGEKIDLATGQIKPRDRNPLNNVRYIVEIAGAVQSNQNSYIIDGFIMSDFVLPAFFDFTYDKQKQYSFNGSIKKPLQIQSGGYVSYKRLGVWWNAFAASNGVLLQNLGGWRPPTANNAFRLKNVAVWSGSVGLLVAFVVATSRKNT